ncbi:Chorismate synthase [Jeotgalicoccus aerolatus]|uniref:Chorismate synthase n=1 Tax=Jeotgalicoccus aerolatus TaxID=709510 RepID=A0A1G8V0B1_9STAP|nr:chorismate synthase [Jeotgalicoccus aerolatus]MBP1951791.1 chorismate synthase [Jeotgalicoccus aerolatus]GGD94768.1 chorismate synthase [Jeotgalicoccus aerolatus]CAD2075194.1 Chorismate synthase [Jeotgalicoccus aerolatus]SDJ58630.1 chorismate synthase [Jeotgalicoccus aerolatus]
MRFLTSGESHGPKVNAIVEGFPSNLPIDKERMQEELFKRQGGYGRGRRMQIEKDTFEFGSGVRHGKTLGSPIMMEVNNDDFKHWVKIMGSEPISKEEEEEMKRIITKPRPGHADLVGGMKYNHHDLRNILERSSARETTARVAVGALCKELLHALDINITSRVTKIGAVTDDGAYDYKTLSEKSNGSSVRMISNEATEEAEKAIDAAKKAGDTLGGVVEVIVENPPVGLGSHVHYDRKLDAKIARSIVSINAFKGVEFGMGFKMAETPGSQVQDEIKFDSEDGFYRSSNNLGGFEGGMTTGMPIVVRGVMKPIPTLYKPLMSVDIHTKEAFTATIERSDPCAVPAASIVAEHMVAIEVAEAILDKFPSDDFGDLKASLDLYNKRLSEY